MWKLIRTCIRKPDYSADVGFVGPGVHRKLQFFCSVSRDDRIPVSYSVQRWQEHPLSVPHNLSAQEHSGDYRPLHMVVTEFRGDFDRVLAHFKSSYTRPLSSV